MLPKLLNAAEVAELLGVDKQRVYELVRRGMIPFINLGRRQYRFNVQELEKWIQNGGTRLDEPTDARGIVMGAIQKAHQERSEPAYEELWALTGIDPDGFENGDPFKPAEPIAKNTFSSENEDLQNFRDYKG